MIILDATTKSLQIKLSGSVTTNQLPFAASYVDSTGTTTTPGEQDGTSNNTTAVTLVSAPASSTQRLVKNIVIQNADTASAKVTVIYNNNSTLRNIIVATLAVGDQLTYEDGSGWVTLDTNGNIKTTGSGGGSGAVSSVSNTDGTLSISPTTGNVVASLSRAGLQTYLPGGLVNKFRNGTFDIWQHGTSGTVTSGNTSYTADGWILGATGATLSWNQTTSLQTDLGTYYGIELIGLTSMTDTFIRQRIESYVMSPLSGQIVTVQCFIFNETGASLTPTLTIKHPNAQDNYTSTTTDVNAVSLQTVPNNSGGIVAYTFNASSSYNGMEVTLDFGSALNSNAKAIFISGADIRTTPNVTTGQNNSPPSPEFRPIEPELAFCQRYFNSTFGNGVTPAQNAGLSGALQAQPYGTTAGNLYTQWNFPVQMRTNPTITTYNPSASNANWRDKTGSSDVVVSVDPDSAIGLSGVMIGSQTTALTVGHRCYIHATASAEI